MNRTIKLLRNFIILSCISLPSFAQDECSKTLPIPNEKKLNFQECRELGQIRIGEIVVMPNIEFEIIHSNYPEGNTIWSKHSPDNKAAVVYIENKKLERNAWVINRETNLVELFIDDSEGRHFIVKFENNSRFVISHAGMGYKVNYIYEKKGVWQNTGREKVKLNGNKDL